MTGINNYHLLVVDDDSLIIDSLRLILPKHWRMTALKNHDNLDGNLNYHAAFVDMHLQPGHPPEGPMVIGKIHSANSKIEIVAMSGDLSLQLMEDCLDNGARKFLAKPLVTAEILSVLEKIEALWLMRTLENRSGQNTPQLLGKSPAVEKVRLQVAQLRGEGGPILLEGETGTGKEVVARLLNAQEPCRSFLAVNVAGIPENLFESELFGHVKGAFTGADQMRIGLAEAANGGDLFLDEVEALNLQLQVKLLRFLESGEVRKVGSKEVMIVKTRVLFASNQNLESLVKSGKFREDLFFRISGKKILLPNLVDRLEDIAILAPYFTNQLRPRINKSFSPEALLALQDYSWPGNVRELKRICEQVALTAPLPILRAEDIKAVLHSFATRPEAQRYDKRDFHMGLGLLIENFEAQVIRELMAETGDVDKSADILKISRSTLYKKLKDYNISERGKGN